MSTARQGVQYAVILKSLRNPNEIITLSTEATWNNAQDARKRWRRALGGDRVWKVDRRPQLDTLDHLALTVIEHVS